MKSSYSDGTAAAEALAFMILNLLRLRIGSCPMRNDEN